MNSKQKQVLRQIFEDPIRRDVKWSDIENLFRALGAQIQPGRGSGIKVKLNAAKASFHRPHPQNTTDKGALQGVRDFLRKAGIHHADL